MLLLRASLLAALAAGAARGAVEPPSPWQLHHRLAACVGAGCAGVREAALARLSQPPPQPSRVYEPGFLPRLAPAGSPGCADDLADAAVVVDLSCGFQWRWMAFHALKDCALANFEAYALAARLLETPAEARGPLAVLFYPSELAWVQLFLGLGAGGEVGGEVGDGGGGGGGGGAPANASDPPAAALLRLVQLPATTQPTTQGGVCFGLGPAARVVYPLQTSIEAGGRGAADGPALAARFRAAALLRAGAAAAAAAAAPAGEAADAGAGAGAGAPTLLHVVRTGRRRLANQGEVGAALRACLPSFAHSVYSGDEPAAAVVRLFASARAVVGQYGAGLGHALLCQPGTVVVELSPRTASGRPWSSLHYSALRASGLTWSVVAHDAVGAPEDAPFWAAARANRSLGGRGGDGGLQEAPQFVMPRRAIDDACRALRRGLGADAAAGTMPAAAAAGRR